MVSLDLSLVRDALKSRRATAAGDVMLDRYLDGDVARLSPEAPVPIVSLRGQESFLGGAGHTASGLAALGIETYLAGVVGADEDGREVELLCDAIPRLRWIGRRSSSTATISKTRVTTDHHRQLLRFDRDGDRGSREADGELLLARILERLDESDLCVLADYDKGTLPESTLPRIIGACRSRGIPCLIDPKKARFDAYAGATVITPNVHEMSRAVGRSLASLNDVMSASQRMRQDLRLGAVVCTCGDQGLVLAGPSETLHLSAEVRDVADVTGAGDTVSAVLGSCLALDMDLADACRLANLAAGAAVSRPRTHVVDFAELERACRGQSSKVVDVELAVRRLDAARRRNRRIVFTNGCFDILHAGHLACLEGARRHGDLLVVGLNSDVSVRLNKGESRPRVGERHRAELLAGLACVDLVVLFDEPTPDSLIRSLAPDVLVKGGDYANRAIAGAEFVIARGGKVVTLPLVDGLSTTNILNDAHAAHGAHVGRRPARREFAVAAGDACSEGLPAPDADPPDPVPSGSGHRVGNAIEIPVVA
jgi:D-beta-D-heptose 7-phosphate kinase/D-beta-D-heptose 1-phosphate adenosyltransferase